MTKEELLIALVASQKQVIELQQEVMRLSKPIVIPTLTDFVADYFGSEIITTNIKKIDYDKS